MTKRRHDLNGDIIRVRRDQLSDRLQNALNQPDWLLHNSLVEAVLENTEFGYYWPEVTDDFWNFPPFESVRSESGYLVLSQTYDNWLLALLPLTVNWEYVGMMYDGAYRLAFHPGLVSADGISKMSKESREASYFKAMESTLANILYTPYLFRPGGEDIIKVPGVKGKVDDRYMLKSEAEANRVSDSPDPLVVKALAKLPKS